MNPSPHASKLTYAGVFTVTLATLMHEVLLTRIFSVTMWYHFAFMAISLAMLGMTAGAVAVYMHPEDYSDVARLKRQMALSSLLFGLTALLSFLVHRTIPFNPSASLGGLWSIASTYAIMSVPFFFSGVCVSAALTKFPAQVSRLYAADLAGAASGCLLLVYTLKHTDGPTAVVLVALLGSIGAGLLAADGQIKGLRRAAIVTGVLLAALAAINSTQARRQSSLLRLTWTKAGTEPELLYEKWNPFSRIAVTRDPTKTQWVNFEGMSPTYQRDRTVKELELSIDASAETTLTSFAGDTSTLDYLKYDVKNLVHYVRPHSRVLIVGAGAGRDVLSAQAFGQDSVRAVEFNEDILETMNGRFGDFTGHLDKDPRVTFVNDEARSYIARLREPFDIIQISFIDTWAATAAGGFALTENSLYTREAWKLFLDRLTPRGILSVSRWYYPALPGEAYRIVSLASAALADDGVTDPRQHIMLVYNLPRSGDRVSLYGAVTILVSKTPFSPEDIATVKRVAQQMQFHMILTPRFALDSTFATLANGHDQAALADFPLNIAPPTDDQPFFFNMLRLRDAFTRKLWSQGRTSFNAKAVSILVTLFGIVTLLTLLCILVPLIRNVGQGPVRGAVPHLVFFGAIGLGFMLIEVSQVERLTIFLGHPTYGLSVVLFALLLSSGMGSYATHASGNAGSKVSALTLLILLLGTLILTGVLTLPAMNAFRAATTPERIIVALALLFPQGFVIGLAFPLGLKLASRHSIHLTPWLWGVNGATSVCGSVLAVAISLAAGISSSFWAGWGFYGLAFVAFAWARRPERMGSSRSLATAGVSQSPDDVDMISRP